MGADILERLDFMLISRRSDEDAIIRDARAEIVRLRGEVDSLRGWFDASRAPSNMSDDHDDAAGDDADDIAPAEAKGPAPAMPNGVEGPNPPTPRDLAYAEAVKHGLIQEREGTSRAADNRDAAGVDSEEDAYVIERMGKLLAEIAVIVNGPEPDMTRWSYHDLPEKVRVLKDTPAAVPAGEAVAWRFYVEDHPDLKPYWTGWGVDEWFRDQMVKRGCRAEYAHPPAATPPAPVQAAPQEGGDSHAFKNFHRSLCARFGYTHDENDWRRDLASLEEHIARMAAHHSACELGAWNDAIEAAASEAEHWQARSGSTHKCGDYIAGAIRSMKRTALQHRGDSQEVGRG